MFRSAPAAALAALCLLSSRLHDAHAAKRPNVVLIMTDDQGYGDLGCHGNLVLKTPRLDDLYKRSVRLTNYHVDPTCSPTRAALMTGRYSSRTGVWHTIMGRSLMHPDELTIAEVFKSAGYKTGAFGKWHLGDNYPLRAADQGFEETLVHGGGGVGQTPDWFGNDYFDDTYWHNGKPAKQTGYCTDVFFDAAAKFIERNKDRPFFCYIPTNAAHGPYLVAKKYSDPYKELGVPSPRAEFYGMIANIDENVGLLEAKLKQLGLAENTILIFTTDNGTAAGTRRQRRGRGKVKPAENEREQQIANGFNGGLRGQKGSEYEGGHRVPFFIHWPAGGLTGGRDVDVLAAHIDVLPTLTSLCQIKFSQSLPLDGTSLAARLQNDKQDGEWPARTLFVHSQRVEHPQKWRKAAVMTERWRLVADGKRRELFDMRTDRGQQKNIAGDHPDVFRKLSGAYEKWYADIGGRFNDTVRMTVGTAHENPTRLTCHDWHTGDKAVPWNQSHIRNDQRANGYWTLDVAKAGRYRITLRSRPEHAKQQLNAVTARIKIGDGDAAQTLPPEVDAAAFTVTLQRGPQRLQTWLTDAAGKERGAYFVEMRLVK